ncbi:oligopeptide ABC transporter permease [Lederbergia panacisoli]|uniref:oligopeptide ABC transporter permease n=1 Tax=Lederbergia panacisoli TaxID=1255251 RepID=UPI00214B1FCB|nr:oligopeptide ABC transporter permease [Lederbergia panacisoli]MCR2820072.1 ABC transporter permease [Lederbergia panacisoli]
MNTIVNKSEGPFAIKNKKGMGPWQIAIRKFARNKTAMFGLCVLILITLVAIFAPYIATADPEKADLMITNQKPSHEHILGTDSSGRDVFSRLVYGSRVSLIIGFSAMVFTVMIGVILGSLAGYFGGIIDSLIMRFCDIMLNFPFILFVLVVISILRSVNIFIFVVVIALTSWPQITRIIRATFLSLREQEFILNAQSVGASDARVIFRHLLPNAMAPIIVNASVFMAYMIIAESSLSFIGFGIPQPTPTWGNMMSDALSLRVLKFEYWLWIPPGLAIFLTVLSINFIGDGLRDALDPRFKND